MKNTARLIAPMSLLAISCSDTAVESAAIDAGKSGSDLASVDHEVLCSSVRRVSKDAVNGFSALKAEERPVPVSQTESISRLYLEYQENETWFYMPEASDCHISASLDRPPGTIRWANYQCRWDHSTLDEAKAAFRDLNRFIEICVDAEDVEIVPEKDGQKLSWRIFRAPDISLHLYTAYYTMTPDDEGAAAPVVDLIFQAGSNPR